jgi:hypothetical protein
MQQPTENRLLLGGFKPVRLAFSATSKQASSIIKKLCHASTFVAAICLRANRPAWLVHHHDG